MSNYVVTTNFAAKDALISGNPLKLITGTGLTVEFNNIATAVASKLDSTAIVAPSGTLPASPYSYNPLAAAVVSNTDNAADLTGNGTNIPSLMMIQQQYGGSNINDGRNGLSIFTALTAPTSPTNAYRFYVGMSAYSNAFVSDNGTGGSPQGIVEAVTGSAQLTSAATNFYALLGGEFTVSANAGSSVTRKAIVCLNNWPTDTVQGSHTDAHIWSTAHAGATGSKVWAKLDDDAGVFPISTGGTLIQLVAALTSPSIATGIDFAGIPVTGNVLQWNSGASFIAGSGAAKLATLALNEALPGGSVFGAQGLAGAYTAAINGSTTTSQSFGLRLQAGTNASDFAFVVQNAVAGANFLLMDGTGKTTFGNSIGVNGATPPAQVSGWGTPAGPAVVTAFPATPTLAQCGAAIGKIIADLKALGIYAA